MDPSEIIIEIVRENECIYNKANPNYKNTLKKKQVFVKISDYLRMERGVEMSAENIEKRWTSLRDMFSRAHRNLKRIPYRPGHEPPKQWELYKNMSFLIPHISHRRSRLNFIGPMAKKKLKSEQDITMESPLLYEDSEISQILNINHGYSNIIEAGSSGSRNINTTPSSIDKSSIVPVTTSPTSNSLSIHAESTAGTDINKLVKQWGTWSSRIEKGFENATALLEKVTTDISSNITHKDPYTSVIEEGLKHVPAENRTKCLIEVLQIIQKYEKI